MVSTRFEDKYQSPEVLNDMVNCIVFNKLNFSIHILDVENSVNHFLKTNHREALLQTKPKTTISKTITRIIKEKSVANFFFFFL